MFSNKPTESIACCKKRSAPRADYTTFFTLFGINNRGKVAHGTSKFLTHWGLIELATLRLLAVHNGRNGITFHASLLPRDA